MTSKTLCETVGQHVSAHPDFCDTCGEPVANAFELINVEVEHDGQWISHSEPLNREQAALDVEAYVSTGRAVRVRVNGSVVYTARPKAVLIEAQAAANAAADANDLYSPAMLADGVSVEQANGWRATLAAEQAAEAAREAADKARLAAFGDRNACIAELRRVLRERTGRAWSVAGDRGTAWGWIKITAPPARRVCREGVQSGPCPCGSTDCPRWYMTEQDREILGAAMLCRENYETGKRLAHHQGESIPASSDYRMQAVQVARGETVTIGASPYWD